MEDSSSAQQLRVAQRKRQVRWGFFWALFTAVLWSAWYVPGAAIYYEKPFVDLSATTKDLLIAAAVVAFLNAIAVLAALLVWVGILGKREDYVRTLRHRQVSRWYLPAAVAGGLAIFGTYLAVVYVGAQFAAVAALLYPIVGALAARIWYHERITRRAAVGITVIVVGAVVIFAPGLIGELTSTGTHGWIGYLAGAATFVGWGLEGAIAGRALDVSDSDVGIAIRFTFEIVLWLVVVAPVATILAGASFWSAVGSALANPSVWLMLLLMGLTFGYCYASWYKSFPLIGVGRGQAVAALYGPLALVWLFLFTHEWPGTQFVVGSAIAVIGGFVLFTERRGLEAVRTVPAEQTQRKAEYDLA